MPTVKEIIEMLETFPQDYKVVIRRNVIDATWDGTLDTERKELPMRTVSIEIRPDSVFDDSKEVSFREK